MMAVDPEDGLQEMADLWLAPTAEALHRVLVLHPPARKSADTLEPFALLGKHHEAEPEQTVPTAVLLLTDARWRSGASHLVRQIADSGLLEEDQLALLARMFLLADDAVYWPVPDDWFDGGASITIGVAAPALDNADDDNADDSAGDEAEAGPAMARREVSPPLRRWAAGHELARDPATWPALLARARELPPRPGAAVMAGMLDRADVLELPARAHLVEHASTWPHQSVRRLAFELMVDRDGADAARALAIGDPNAKIRAWAANPTPDPVPSRQDEAEPPTLF
jgi:hypothetical protein